MKKTPWYRKLLRQPQIRYYAWSSAAIAGVCTAIFILTLSIPVQGEAQGLSQRLAVANTPTPADLSLLSVALQREYAQLMAQVKQFQVLADQVNKEIETTASCERACPGGPYAIQCTQETRELCISHDSCIRACDKNIASLQARIARLKKQEADIIKKGEAFVKKVEAYKAKNKKKFSQ